MTPHFHPEVGGLESAVRLLAVWLADRGHAVTVHTSARTTDGKVLPAADALGRVAIRRYPLRLDLGYFRSVFRPEVRGADVVHLNGYGVLTNDLVARRARAPVVYSLFHGVSMPHPSAFTRLERSVYDRVIGVRTLRRASALIVLNRLDLAWLEARRAGAGKASVLPAALPDDAFLPGDPARARERYGGAPFVLYLGRLHREKGEQDHVRALAEVPDREAWFVGPDAGAGPALLEEARALGVEGRVRLLGYVPDETKRDLLAACECLVLPSYHEAQGLVVAEAWAQGRAVVATRAGALPEWIEEGVTGFLVPWGDPAALADALRRVVGDPARAAEMGRRGAERAAALRMDAIGPAHEALYARVTGGPP